ncbi:MAG TPA: hemerythrin domain-containing protein [Acidimicrobiales bacterium]|nr:hemerythrin domain-containing protein [Acidimicrobiales bacterium]
MTEVGHTDVAPTTAARTDIVELLLRDHAEAKAMLARFETAPAGQKTEAFWELTRTLVQHEVAEEEVLYPIFRKRVANGSKIAGARVAEQSRAEEMLDELERRGVDHAGFAAGFRQLHMAVLDHARLEEQTVFPALRSALQPEELGDLGRRYERAKAVAPTHPHPHAPDTPPGNLVLGPVASLVDRVRDTIRTVLDDLSKRLAAPSDRPGNSG